MYHAARSAVYVQMQLDVAKHQALIDKFGKLLKREFNDDTLADRMNIWRVTSIKCDYDPVVNITVDMCNNAIKEGEIILTTCKSRVEAF